MTFKDFDMVEVIKDVPEKSIKAGMRGMVIDVYHKPNLAYEVEFCDESGEPVIEVALLPEQLVRLENKAKP